MPTTSPSKPTIGLIVPPADGRVPVDAKLLYADRVNFIARGLGIAAISPEGFAPVVHTIVDHAKALRDAGAQAISLMGTSLSFYRGPAFTEDLRQEMQLATELPCTTMSHAVVASLRALGVHRIAVATSYIDELNQHLVSYLEHSGFEVAAIEGMSISGVKEVGEVSTQRIYELAMRLVKRSSAVDGVFISCGGLLTLEAIQRLESELQIPVAASSPSGFWDVMRARGIDPSSPGYGRLFEPGLQG